MSVQFKELDLGWDQLHRNIKESSSKVAVVGIIGGGEELRKAVANEFGTDKIPERPFMRQTFDKVEPDIKKKKKEGLNQIIFDNVPPSRVLSRIGNFYRSEIRKAIRGRKFKANADSTLKRKLGKITDVKKKKRIEKHIAKVGKEAATQGPIPLIDTGKMIQSLKVEIRND